jgi:hypothetical protein
MRVQATRKAEEYIRERGGDLWVWLDPHRSLIGSYVYLEAATEPPGTSRQTRFTRSSRQPHRFTSSRADGFGLHVDWGRLDPPDELQIALRGWRNKRVEAYWNGCVFAGPDVPPPSEEGA